MTLPARFTGFLPDSSLRWIAATFRRRAMPHVNRRRFLADVAAGTAAAAAVHRSAHADERAQPGQGNRPATSRQPVAAQPAPPQPAAVSGRSLSGRSANAVSGRSDHARSVNPRRAAPANPSYRRPSRRPSRPRGTRRWPPAVTTTVRARPPAIVVDASVWVAGVRRARSPGLTGASSPPARARPPARPTGPDRRRRSLPPRTGARPAGTVHRPSP